jgi:hypothetical protein
LAWEEEEDRGVMRGGRAGKNEDDDEEEEEEGWEDDVEDDVEGVPRGVGRAGAKKLWTVSSVIFTLLPRGVASGIANRLEAK